MLRHPLHVCRELPVSASATIELFSVHPQLIIRARENIRIRPAVLIRELVNQFRDYFFGGFVSAAVFAGAR